MDLAAIFLRLQPLAATDSRKGGRGEVREGQGRQGQVIEGKGGSGSGGTGQVYLIKLFTVWEGVLCVVLGVVGVVCGGEGLGGVREGRGQSRPIHVEA